MLRLDLGKDVIYESPLALKDILRKKKMLGAQRTFMRY